MTPPFHDRGGREKGRKRGGRGLFCAKKGKTTRQPLVQRREKPPGSPLCKRGKTTRQPPLCKGGKVEGGIVREIYNKEKINRYFAEILQKIVALRRKTVDFP